MNAGAISAPAPEGRARKLGAFIELGKLRIVELWLGVPLAWSLLSPALRSRGTTFLVLAFAALVEVGTTSASLALDDVSGLRDGVDAANHADTDRYGVNKPLLDGRLSEREALGYAWFSLAVALAALIGALVFAPHLPWWEPLIALGTIALGLNYSYGARLSYVGGCEMVTLLAMVATVIFPFGLLHGGLSPAAAVEAALLGLWMLQVALFSNTQDAAGDREAGRLTLAARVEGRVNRRVIAAIFAVSATLAVAMIATGVLPWWSAPLLGPSWLLQAAQLRAGLGVGDWLRARALGFIAFRVAIAALLVANLLAS